MATLQCYDQCPPSETPTQLALMPCYQCPAPEPEAPATPPVTDPDGE